VSEGLHKETFCEPRRAKRTPNNLGDAVPASCVARGDYFACGRLVKRCETDVILLKEVRSKTKLASQKTALHKGTSCVPPRRNSRNNLGGSVPASCFNSGDYFACGRLVKRCETEAVVLKEAPNKTG
jgi:hypothetical protein